MTLIVAGAALALGQERPDRSRPPVLEAPPPLHLPAIQKRVLTNGLAVWVVESHEVPIVQLSLLVRAGGGDDPAGRFGTASLTAGMLDEGAGTRSALEIADFVEFLGATLTTASSYDVSAARLNVPTQRLADALPLFADVALRPSFPDKELERLRQERLTALLQARDDASSIAGMAFARLVFGPSHRYGTGLTGTEASLEAISATDLRAFHDAYYQPANGVLLAVGDTTADRIVPMVEQTFGGWRSTGAPVRQAVLPTVPRPRSRRIVIVDKPDAEQSQIRVGGVGVARSTPDYFPLIVLNTVLGGAFTSRLNQNLREDHGYAYGASSVFDMRLSAGPFVAAAGVQTDKSADALREFFNELNGIRMPIAEDELAKARNYIALGFPSEFETTTDLSRRLEELAAYRLPDDYFERYVARVIAVTRDDVHRVAETYVLPAQFIAVVVGDRKTIEPGIRALNLGPVETMTVAQALN